MKWPVIFGLTVFSNGFMTIDLRPSSAVRSPVTSGFGNEISLLQDFP